MKFEVTQSLVTHNLSISKDTWPKVQASCSAKAKGQKGSKGQGTRYICKLLEKRQRRTRGWLEPCSSKSRLFHIIVTFSRSCRTLKRRMTYSGSLSDLIL